MNQRLSNVCVLFKDLENEDDCKNCISGKMYDLENCACDKNNEECVVSSENFILVIPTLTETECFLECSRRNDCHFYTWYSSEHDTFKNECLLFKSCDNVEPCTQGCFSGSTNSICNPTTSTPMPLTTSEVPNVCNNLDYMILSDSTRNINYVTDPHFIFCDDFNSFQNEDWKGPGWYRIMGPAGTQLPEEIVMPYHCGTSFTGWLNGTHPTVFNEIVDRNVCFHSINGDPCLYQSAVQILNCGEFYLYS